MQHNQPIDPHSFDFRDALRFAREERRVQLRDDIAAGRRTASRERMWRRLFWVALGGVFVLFGGVRSAPRPELIGLSALGYLLITEKIDEAHSNLEEVHVRLKQLGELTELVLDYIATVDYEVRHK